MELMRRLLFVAALLVVLAANPGSAQAIAVSPSTTVATSDDLDLGKCVSALPPPTCGEKPKAPGDPGGAAQIALFTIMVGGLVFIGSVIVRSTRKTAKTRPR
jgi:hypothetical protein